VGEQERLIVEERVARRDDDREARRDDDREARRDRYAEEKVRRQLGYAPEDV
jgi:hypothetical protein